MRPGALLALVGSVGMASVPGAAWAQGNPLGPEFRVNTYTTNQQDSVSVARVKSSGPGPFVVVWSSYGQDGSSGGVFGQQFNSSGFPLGPEFRVNTYTTNTQRRPSVAVDGGGYFVVVWESGGQDGSSYGVFGQRFANTGVPLGSEFRVNTYTTLQQGYPSVAMELGGNFVVVWNSNGPDGQDYGVFGQRYAASGAPLGTEFQINTYTTGYQAHPSVAWLAFGTPFMVVWTSYGQDGSSAGVFGQRFAGGGSPMGPEFRVNTFTTGHQGATSIDTDGNTFVVVWSSYGEDGSDRGVFGRAYFQTGDPLGSTFRVNTYTTGYQGGASVASDNGSAFVVVWSSDIQDGASTGVFGQRYSWSGPTPDGPEFRVNTYTTGAQELAAVAADGGNLVAGGDFVVVWRSYGQDGSSHGVFGQRFDSMTVPVELMHFGVE